MSLALSQPAPAKGQTSKPSGVLTFSSGTNFFDYNIKSGELTDYGKGKDAYRAKNGYALVKDNNNSLILVSPDGKTRRTVVAAKVLGATGFILSPDGKTIIYDQMSNDPGSRNVLVVHNVQTGDETEHPIPDFDWPVPQDWMPDGSLLFSPFGEQKFTSDKGESVSLDWGIVSKDFASVAGVWVDQPGTKPVDEISDPRVEPTRIEPSRKRIGGERIAFSWDAHIWIANFDGISARQVTKSEGFAVGEDEPAWSPDGKWIAVHYFDGLLSDIYLVPVDDLTHSMGDKTVIRLLDKNGITSTVKGSGLRCSGRITWR